jgi:hypothetical protein
MNTTIQGPPEKTERKTIATVSLKIRLLLVAIFLGGVLAVIVPAAANIHGARQEFVQELCQSNLSLTPRVVCGK